LYGSWSTSSSAASFFSITLADASETPCARAIALTDTRSPPPLFSR
jgi:hypothetical protein